MSDANMLTLALETYQRLFPEMKHKLFDDPTAIIQPRQAEPSPTLQEIIEAVRPVPPQTCVVGICEDHVPFLLDMSQPETGALLVTGDPAAGKTAHLRILVESVMALNSPHEVKIGVLSNQPDQWRDLAEDSQYMRYFTGVHAWYEPGAAELITRLVGLGEDRATGRHLGATMLLIVDDLQNAFKADFEVQNGLHWLLEYGVFSQIRPVASLDAGLCPGNEFWIDAFRTFLIGKISDDSLAEALGLSGLFSTRDLIPNHEFRAFTGKAWTKYCLPQVG